jgi:spermidine synthase
MASIETIEAAGYFQESAPLQQTSTRYPVEQCLVATRTKIADVVIISNNDYGRMLFLDNELQSSSYDEHIYHESLVHPMMHSMNNVDDKHVLVVGGAEGATVREVLKWGSNKVRQIDWVDIDGELVDICRESLCYTPNSVYNNNSVKYYSEDIMVFLNKPERHSLYHTIIIDLPDPDPNEPVLYGADFWDLIYTTLKPDGGIVTHVGPVEPGRRPGLDMVISGTGEYGHPYHTYIPSFQGEWGFWMNKPPALLEGQVYPINRFRVYDMAYISTVFHWDRHWLGY